MIVTLVLGRVLSCETSCILPFHYRIIVEVVYLGQWSNYSELLIAFLRRSCLLCVVTWLELLIFAVVYY